MRLPFSAIPLLFTIQQLSDRRDLADIPYKALLLNAVMTYVQVVRFLLLINNDPEVRNGL